MRPVWTGLALVLWLALVAAWALSQHGQPIDAHVPAAPAPEVKHEERVPVTMAAPVAAYKPAVKKKLDLPEPVQRDEAQHVVASVLTPNDERRHTVTTVVNAQTGEVTSYDRAEPMPWLAPGTKTELGLFYGIKDGGETVRLQARRELLQVKAVRVGATASADFSPGNVDTFVGVGIWARW